MSSVIVSPSVLRGEVCVPPSKSAAHRAVLCAAMAKGESKIFPIALSKDLQATLQAVQALGADVCEEGNVFYIDGSRMFSTPHAEIDCGESGSLLRFIIPMAAAGGVSARFQGHGRLPERPIGVYLDCLPTHGVECRTKGGLPLSIAGRLRGGVYSLPGNISSQFITGLLLALPLATEDSEIRLTTPLESEGYVHMTLTTMREFGVTVEPILSGWKIQGNQRYKPHTCMVEADWSQAAFFIAAAALGGQITLKGLLPGSEQGDKAAETLFSAFGAKLQWRGDVLSAEAGELTGITIDAVQIPDLVPMLAATAATAKGTTVITGAERLRIKESDRLAAMAWNLKQLGGQVEERRDGLIITGVPQLSAGKVKGFNDHRVVMAMAIAALNAAGPVEIDDAESVQKSYPAFFEDYCSLGGVVNVVDMG